MENNIEVKNITKKFKDFSLKDVSLSVPKGSIIGLIGENGAGKTTLIKCILDTMHIDMGSITVLGKDSTHLVKEEVGVVLDGAFFPEILKGKDMAAIMKKIFKNWDDPLFLQYIKDFKIPLEKPIKELSKGMRKKLEIASALAHHPEVLILDEPTSGLDPVVRNEILDIFLEFTRDENHSILLSSHITSDLEHIADQIAFMEDGKMIFCKEKDTLLEEYGIIRCEENVFTQIKKEEMISYRKNKYSYDILINNKKEILKKYKDIVMDTPAIDEIMFLYSKGEQK
ncbi:MAG: ABC transporter ATP-binding protein [Bacilli bacterium]|nr:ABC transporter ATP-binding protein [Bacilli bacterium]